MTNKSFPDVVCKARRDASAEREMKYIKARASKMTDHPNLHLLTLERTGWRRWLLGRWVYSCEPFRHDFARRLADLGGHIECGPHETSLVYHYRALDEKAPVSEDQST